MKLLPVPRSLFPILTRKLFQQSLISTEISFPNILYYEILLEQQDTRVLYLAIKESAYQEIFEEPIGKILLKRKIINLVVFDEKKEVILQWIS